MTPMEGMHLFDASTLPSIIEENEVFQEYLYDVRINNISMDELKMFPSKWWMIKSHIMYVYPSILKLVQDPSKRIEDGAIISRIKQGLKKRDENDIYTTFSTNTLVIYEMHPQHEEKRYNNFLYDNIVDSIMNDHIEYIGIRDDSTIYFFVNREKTKTNYILTSNLVKLLHRYIVDTNEQVTPANVEVVCSAFWETLLKSKDDKYTRFIKRSSLFGITLSNSGLHNCGITSKHMRLYGVFLPKQDVVIKCSSNIISALVIEYYRRIHKWELPFVETLAFGWSWNTKQLFSIMRPVIPLGEDLKAFFTTYPSPPATTDYIKYVLNKTNKSLDILHTYDLDYTDRQFANAGWVDASKKMVVFIDSEWTPITDIKFKKGWDKVQIDHNGNVYSYYERLTGMSLPQIGGRKKRKSKKGKATKNIVKSQN